MTRKLSVALLALCLLPALAVAWWNEEWGFRKQIILDTTPAGANIGATVNDVPLLVRLHLGNFGYFADTQPDGADIRFVAADDVTPLAHHIESYDAAGQMAFVWVRVPRLTGNSATDSVYMYYGNGSAASGNDASGSWDVNQVLAYHFEGAAPHDATAYANQPASSTAEADAASLIGSGVRFSGAQSIAVPASPSLRLLPDAGLTLSAWVHLDAPQADASLFELGDGANGLVLGIEAATAYARLTSAGTVTETPRTPAFEIGAWVHLALSAGAGELRVYVNGVQAAAAPATLPEIGGTLTVGAGADATHFLSGQLDELQASNVARSADWLAAAVGSQGMGGALLKYGEDAQAEGAGGSESYFIITLRNVTVDGWVVIGFLALMSMVSWVVMIAKGMVIRRVRKENAAFLREFQKIGTGDPAALDREESAEGDAEDHPMLVALSGEHDHFQASTVYRLYHAGIHQVKQRVSGATVGAQRSHGIGIESIDAIRAVMDAKLVRETQKLNSQMVLLTLAIAGGPFLGLLGTVIGVMITFAAIAASGDVNVNAIAPGIAASLAATVAGLVVAIPALFGYNYLSTRIKEIVADMRVFLDEFVTRVAEHYAAT